MRKERYSITWPAGNSTTRELTASEAAGFKLDGIDVRPLVSQIEALRRRQAAIEAPWPTLSTETEKSLRQLEQYFSLAIKCDRCQQVIVRGDDETIVVAVQFCSGIPSLVGRRAFCRECARRVQLFGWDRFSELRESWTPEQTKAWERELEELEAAGLLHEAEVDAAWKCQVGEMSNEATLKTQAHQQLLSKKSELETSLASIKGPDAREEIRRKIAKIDAQLAADWETLHKETGNEAVDIEVGGRRRKMKRSVGGSDSIQAGSLDGMAEDRSKSSGVTAPITNWSKGGDPTLSTADALDKIVHPGPKIIAQGMPTRHDFANRVQRFVESCYFDKLPSTLQPIAKMVACGKTQAEIAKELRKSQPQVSRAVKIIRVEATKRR